MKDNSTASGGVIAALYVETGGCYFGLPDVDPWDEARDARTVTNPTSKTHLPRGIVTPTPETRNA